MIYDRKNKVLQGDTIIISELSGNIVLTITAEEIQPNTAYYVEILCPKNLKYCLERCAVQGRVLSVIVPNNILNSRGDIYAQLVCRDTVSGRVLDKSLVTALPIITVTRAINASETVNVNAVTDVISEMIKAKDKMEIVAVELREDIVDKVGWTEVNVEFNKINDEIVRINDITTCDNFAFDTLNKIANMIIYCKRRIDIDIVDMLTLVRLRLLNLEELTEKYHLGAVMSFDYTNSYNVAPEHYMDSIEKMERKYGGGWAKYTGVMGIAPPDGSDKMFSYVRIT